MALLVPTTVTVLVVSALRRPSATAVLSLALAALMALASHHGLLDRVEPAFGATAVLVLALLAPAELITGLPEIGRAHV